MWHQGAKFVARFDANSYLRIMEMWQTFDLLAQTGAADHEQAFAPCREQRYMVFSIDSDVCYYPDEQQDLALANMLAQARALAEGDPADETAYPGNHPSTTLMFQKLDPETLGKDLTAAESGVIAIGDEIKAILSEAFTR